MFVHSFSLRLPWDRVASATRSSVVVNVLLEDDSICSSLTKRSCSSRRGSAAAACPGGATTAVGGLIAARRASSSARAGLLEDRGRFARGLAAAGFARGLAAGAGAVPPGAAGAGTARGLDERDRSSSHFEALRLAAKAWISWKFFLPLHHLTYAPDALCFQNVLSQVLHTSLLFDGILMQPSPVPSGLPHMTHQFAVLPCFSAEVRRAKLMTES